MSEKSGNSKPVDLDIGTISHHLGEVTNILRGPVPRLISRGTFFRPDMDFGTGENGAGAVNELEHDLLQGIW